MVRSKWFIGLLLVLMTACATSQKAVKNNEKASANLHKDKDEYKVIVTDTGFEQWFLTHSGGSYDHSEPYYKSWNARYVDAWNHRVMNGRYFPSLFSNTIDYDRDTDYGMEVNRKLYYYFRWVETELRIPILDYRRPAGIL